MRVGGNRLDQDRLGDVRAARNGAADGPGHFGFQGLVKGLGIGGRGGRSVSAGAEAPDELLLRRPIDLHRQQPRMDAGQPGEDRLRGHLFAVEEAEIGVVGHDDQVAALVGRLAQQRTRPGPSPPA